MGFQVDRVTHRLCFGLKEITRWDLRLTQSKRQVARENRPAWVCEQVAPENRLGLSVCGQVARENRPIFLKKKKKRQVTHDNETISF
jgi:hypothetical protein